MGLMCPFDCGFSLAPRYPVTKLRCLTDLAFIRDKVHVGFEFALALRVEL